MSALEDDLALEALLAESELEHDAELLELAGALRSLGTGPAPAPSAQLAALLVAPASGTGRRRRRGVLVGVLLAASLGGGAAAAASPAFHQAEQPTAVASSAVRLGPIERDQPVAVPPSAAPRPSTRAATGGTDAGARTAPAAKAAVPAPEIATPAHRSTAAAEQRGDHHGSGRRATPSRTPSFRSDSSSSDDHDRGAGEDKGKWRWGSSGEDHRNSGDSPRPSGDEESDSGDD